MLAFQPKLFLLTMKDKVMIVEDDLLVAADIRKTIERNGFRVAGMARTAEKALQVLEDVHPTLAILDIFLKGTLTGIDLAGHLNKKGIPFIYLSANSNQQVLEAAKATNPFGFVVKPFREKDLIVTIDIALYRHENNRKMGMDFNAISAAERGTSDECAPKERNRDLANRSGFSDIIGRSAPILQAFKLVEQVAPFDSSVLILGESGTGKEGIANCIVRQSKRAAKPFIKINCAAIPANLMESELFGHEKGAFTNAIEKKIGKFELAAGGTILLDEIGEMAPDMQVKLLRVLQEKEIQRIGGNTTIKTDVRVIAATSKVLEKEVADGRFRLDLYYRLLVFPITLPPLRERKDDIPLLANHFVRYYSEKTGKNIRSLHPKALESLSQYHWPGNVRELQHVIERSILLAYNDVISEVELPRLASDRSGGVPNAKPFKTLEEIEKDYIIEVLGQCNYKVSGSGGAAELLHLPASTLHSKMKKLGIKLKYGQ